MIAYHGSTEIILYPDVNHSKRYLDFGQGFYITTYKMQAENWARRKSVRNSKPPIVNIYDIPDNWDDQRVLMFRGVDADWLEFVCACRQGSEKFRDYDVIIGNVADDDVFKAVDMYSRGIWDKEKTLGELRYYKKNDQICLTSQSAISRIKFTGSYNLKG